MASTSDLIRTAVERFQAEVPALQKLKLVFGLELKGRGDIQLYRVELPGPQIKKDLAQDERVLVEIDRAQFNELAEKGTLKSYRRAWSRPATSRPAATPTCSSSSPRWSNARSSARGSNGSAEAAMSSAGPPHDPAWSVRRRYFPAVEGMRGVAALSVLLGHVLLFSYSSGHLHDLGRWLAPFGLVVFFTISGFLLYRPFLAARQAGESVGELTPSYLWRRAVRILPAYWVALTISAIWLGWDAVFSYHWWVYYGLLQAYSPDWVLNGIAPAWSLCVEITFYLALPLIALALAGVGLGSGRGSGLRWEVGVLAAIALGSLAWRIVVGAHASSHYLENTLPGCLGWFCVGMLLAAIEVIHPARLARLRSALADPRLCWPAGVVLFAALPLGVQDRLGLGPHAQVVAEVLLLGAGALLLLSPAVLAERRPAVGWLLENRLAVFVGTISYGIYLWHWAFLSWFDQRQFVLSSPFPFALLTLTTLAASLLGGIASWYLVEKPLMQRARSVKAFRHVRRGEVEVASEG